MFGKKKKVKHEKHHTDYKVSSENLAMPELHIGEGRSEKAPEKRKDEFITYEMVNAIGDENVAIPEIHIKKSSNSPQDR